MNLELTSNRVKKSVKKLKSFGKNRQTDRQAIFDII